MKQNQRKSTRVYFFYMWMDTFFFLDWKYEYCFLFFWLFLFLFYTCFMKNSYPNRQHLVSLSAPCLCAISLTMEPDLHVTTHLLEIVDQQAAPLAPPTTASL